MVIIIINILFTFMFEFFGPPKAIIRIQEETNFFYYPTVHLSFIQMNQ